MSSGVLLKSGQPVASITRIARGWEAILLSPLHLVGQYKDKGKAVAAVERSFK